ncbi:putative ppe family protein [Golovinomyces cichoracearum]|uniref:Putative ppe family protein n=1 Tax=Golovinomyces cichoracearum TaxID=62708 RepID=A0A420IN76_9PEZI|nr:putative ppe family protein [Golovinomyces cichoracearum]
MQFFNFLFLVACISHLTIAHPLSLQDRQFGRPSSRSVSQAADNFARDAGIVSNALNTLPAMTDKKQIQSTAQKAFEAETDEDDQRSVLAAAAGFSGLSPDGKIKKFTPTVLKSLKEMARIGTPTSVQKNVPIIEEVRNPNILPSITQLSNAAMSLSGLGKNAKVLKKTTGSSKIKGEDDDKNGFSSTKNNSSSNNKEDDSSSENSTSTKDKEDDSRNTSNVAGDNNIDAGRDSSDNDSN